MGNPVKVGEKFGRLTVVQETDLRDSSRARIVVCRCDCGKEIQAVGSALRKRHTRSCGCLSKELTGSRRRQPPGTASWNFLFMMYKRNAKVKGREFLLTMAQFQEICSQDCRWCGDPPRNYNRYMKQDGSRGKLSSGTSPEQVTLSWIKAGGVDRRDNDKGYFYDNCKPACFTCNRMRGDSTEEEFKAHLNKMQAYQSTCIFYGNNIA